MTSRPVGDALPSVDVVLVAEQRIVREGLRKLFESEPGFTVVAETSVPDEAVHSITALKPDVVVISLSGRLLARMMRTLLDLSTAGHAARTILLTTTLESGDITRARRLGVSAILLDETSLAVLFDTARTVASGRHWLGRERLDECASRLRDAIGTTNHYGLTKRELEIVDAVVRGETNRTIAGRLSITQDTVKHHLTKAFTKVGVFTRRQLAAFAVNHSLSSWAGREEPAASPVCAPTRFCRTAGAPAAVSA